MLAVGVGVRLVLIPITRGQDFIVWDRATSATLRGTNVYANHPNYPGGPFAYFPLFLYVELPFQWVAHFTGVAFTIVGKLPMLAGDLATSVIVAKVLSERGRGRRAAAMGAGLFFLNPLILYNSAYYGRFDSIGCALLLIAVRRLEQGRRGASLWYALAVATKTFPIFVLPAILRAARGARIRTLLALAVVIIGVSAPYLTTWRPYLHDIVVYDAVKTPQFLSWQRLLGHIMAADAQLRLSYVLLGAFVVGVVLLAPGVHLERSVTLTLVLFIPLSKVVLEQYLTWPLPWLILAIWMQPRRAAVASAGMVLIFTAIGFFSNADIHPFGRSAWWLEIGLAVCCAGYLVISLATPSASYSPRDRPTQLDEARVDQGTT